MENVTHVQSELTSSRPPGQVIVDHKVQSATVYATANGSRPVEDTDIFFKEHIGTIQTSTTDARGTLLLTIDLNFNHGELLASRKQNYAYNRYKQLRIEGKRTDVIFGRSGSIGVIYTTNPWYQLSSTDAAANALAAQSDPTYRVLTISDSLDMDLNGMIKDFVREGGWYFANPSDTMPLDYHIAGRIFVLTEIPPQLLSYQIPFYLAGTIQVKDYIPTALASLTYAKTRVDSDATLVSLTWNSQISQYVVDMFSEFPIGSFDAVGSYIPDQAVTKSITIEETPAEGEEVGALDYPQEVHFLDDFPCEVVTSEDSTRFQFRCTISKLSNFNSPRLVSHDIPPLHGWAVFEDDTAKSYKTFRGAPLDLIPQRPVSMRKEVVARVVGSTTMANLARVARGQRPLVVTRPADADVTDLSHLVRTRPM